jgi:Putative F0F1-ATPase subunit (ATPase_gene1).
MADRERHQKGSGTGKHTGPAGVGSAASFAGLGIQLAVSILLFLYVGQWLDKKFGTDPLLLILGVFTGAGLGFYNMYHVLTAAQRKDRATRDGDDK